MAHARRPRNGNPASHPMRPMVEPDPSEGDHEQAPTRTFDVLLKDLSDTSLFQYGRTERLVGFARQTGGARVQRVVAGSLPVVQGVRPCSKWIMTKMMITMENDDENASDHGTGQ
jgi:hypothetical protein